MLPAFHMTPSKSHDIHGLACPVVRDKDPALRTAHCSMKNISGMTVPYVPFYHLILKNLSVHEEAGLGKWGLALDEQLAYRGPELVTVTDKGPRPRYLSTGGDVLHQGPFLKPGR